MPLQSITRQQVPAQTTLIVRSQVTREELPDAIGAGMGRVFPYAQRAGIAIAGRPFARYVGMDGEQMSIEVGAPVVAPAKGEGEIEVGSIPGGPVVVGVHMGPYDQLHETFEAMERWLAENGLRSGGAPWESYITDPDELSDPAQWRTDVYWPLAE